MRQPDDLLSTYVTRLEIEPVPDRRFDIRRPEDGSLLASAFDCDERVVSHVLERARGASVGWAKSDSRVRRAALLSAADRVEEEADELARLLSVETGKALHTECYGEVAIFIDILRYFAGLSTELKGQTTSLGDDILGFVTRQPHGVVASILPWNVPLMQFGYKVAAPVAAGNVVVVKPPEQATLTILAVVELMIDLFPAGVLEVLTGRGESTGRALVDGDVDKVSFTGSVETGREIAVASARQIRPASLELGGKSPMIILDDCPADRAISGIFRSMRFTRAGQSCTASTRVYVPRSQLSSILDALGDALDDVVVGPPLLDSTQCGPVVSAEQRDKIERYLARAQESSLRVEQYGKMSPEADVDGYYVLPHVIVDPPDDHPCAVDEIFGPVVCLFSYDDLAGAIERSNASNFGLSASVWGSDINRCMQAAADLSAGIVQVNQNAVMIPGIAYGGIRHSGLGREGSLEAMLESYTWPKTHILNYAGRASGPPAGS